MRIMGIDYGDARTGLAVSDAMNILVGEAWTVNQWDANVLADEIVKQAESRGIERFVLGLPKNMDGTEGARAENAANLPPFSAAKPTFQSSCGTSVAAASRRTRFCTRTAKRKKAPQNRRCGRGEPYS